MVCEDCGTVYYSAAARTMIARGERCTNCGGKLAIVNGPPPRREREKCKSGRTGGDPPAGTAA